MCSTVPKKKRASDENVLAVFLGRLSKKVKKKERKNFTRTEPPICYSL